MTTGSRIRTTGIWILMASLVLTLGTASALAWGKKDSGQKDRPPRAVNKHQYPDMVFERGTLNKDLYGGWEMGGKSLVFNRNTRITQGGDDFSTPALEEGCEALVTGYVRGGVMVVHRLTMIDPDESIQRGSYNAVTTTSDPPEMNANTPH